MAFEIPLFSMPNCQAESSALYTKQYRFMHVKSSGKTNVFTAAGLVPVGVLQSTPKRANEVMDVMAAGVTPVVAGATLKDGQQVRSDSAGAAVPYTGGTTHYCVGWVAPGGGASASALATIALNCLNPWK